MHVQSRCVGKSHQEVLAVSARLAHLVPVQPPGFRGEGVLR